MKENKEVEKETEHGKVHSKRRAIFMLFASCQGNAVYSRVITFERIGT